MNAVRLAIRTLSEGEFAQYFGPLHQQIRSHHDASVDRLVALPAAVPGPEAVVYKQDVYLGVDIEASGLADRAREIAGEAGLDFEEDIAPQHSDDVTSREREDWTEFGEELLAGADPADVELDVGGRSKPQHRQTSGFCSSRVTGRVP